MVAANNLADYARRVTLVRRQVRSESGDAADAVQPRAFAEVIHGDETEPVGVEGVVLTELRWDPSEAGSGGGGIEGVLVEALVAAHGQFEEEKGAV